MPYDSLVAKNKSALAKIMDEFLPAFREIVNVCRNALLPLAKFNLAIVNCIQDRLECKTE